MDNNFIKQMKKYISDWEEAVSLLRRVRDRVGLSSNLGKEIDNFLYSVDPPTPQGEGD